MMLEDRQARSVSLGGRKDIFLLVSRHCFLQLSKKDCEKLDVGNSINKG
jgi:hypothetical protein